MSTSENSVRHLANFYTVVAGLALTTAILNLVDAKGTVLPFKWHDIALLLAFLATLLPFYHGAMRHLDKTYVENAGQKPQPGALLADFVILLLESCFFIALAAKIREPVIFACIYAGLLCLDAVWGYLAYMAFSPRSEDIDKQGGAALDKKRNPAELIWSRINFVTFVITLVLFYVNGLFSSLNTTIETQSFVLAILAISLVRTIVDYWESWDYYYD